MNSPWDFDVIVIGSGPGGSSAAIEAAKLGKRVALVERKENLGGIWVHAGTITSKLLRSAIVNIRATGRVLGIEGKDLAARFSMPDLVAQVDHVVAQETQAVSWRLARSHVTLFSGLGAFLDPHKIVVTSDFDTREISAEHFVIATGSTPKRPQDIPFDGVSVLDEGEILGLKTMPGSLLVAGAGIIGLEYADMFAALGVRTTVVDRHKQVLDFVDRELADRLTESLQALGVVLRLGETVETVRKDPERVVAVLAGGEDIAADCVLCCIGRRGNVERLNLGAVGIRTNEEGFLSHDDHFRTGAPHVYAVGDVAGFPALASTAMMQGRVAAAHLSGQPVSAPQRIPYALFTIPEMAMIGMTEEQLQADKVRYEVGRARYYDTVTGQLIDDSHGMLKLLFRPETREILGIHCIGSSSADMIHIGQAVMELGGTLDYFKDAVFNLPTLAESYRLAALDGLNKVS